MTAAGCGAATGIHDAEGNGHSIASPKMLRRDDGAQPGFRVDHKKGQAILSVAGVNVTSHHYGRGVQRMLGDAAAE
jgi:hypothetical protein